MPRISALPQMQNLAAADELPIHDVSEATTKKVTFGQLLPTGAVTDFAGAAAPAGWLLCYGQTLDAVTNPEYSALYDVIGVTFGGTGISSFKLPDARGRVTAGADDMGGSAANRLTTAGLGAAAVLAAAGGAETVTLENQHIAPHWHSIFLNTNHGDGTSSSKEALATALQAGGRFRYRGGTGQGLNGNTFQGNDEINGTTNRATAAHNNVQPTLILNKIIKY